MFLEYCEQPDLYNDTETSLVSVCPYNDPLEVIDGEIYLVYIYVGY